MQNSSNHSVEFKNPQLLALDKLVLETENEKIPALSSKWLENHRFSKYTPLKLKRGLPVNESEWFAGLEQFNIDLKWMLGLNFHRFWSNVLYDNDFLNPLLYFLQESTPYYIPLQDILEDYAESKEIYDSVCKNSLLIICRLITNRESETEFMSKERQAEIIYGKFSITIPMIFDMLTIFGYSNKLLIQKFIDTLLAIEPKYSNDLKLGIKFILSTFDVMKKQLETIDSSNLDLYEKYEDLCLYLMNISSTLNLLIDLVPNDIKVCSTLDLHLELAISNLSDSFIPLLFQYSQSVDENAWFLNYINYSRVELINCFRILVNRDISMILNSGEKNRQKYADRLLTTLSECAGNRSFISDYGTLYPIDIDLDIIAQSGKNVDQVKMEFVRKAYNLSSNNSNGFHAYNDNDDFEAFETEGACALPLPQMKTDETAAGSDDAIEIETSKILELFPSYGVGYIRRLLSFYENSSEKAIEKILEGNLDTSLKKLDEQEPYIPPETPDKVFAETGLIRSNIYDGDKFDVFTNDEFAGHVKKNGNFITKKQPKTFHELFNDKSHVESLKNRYQGYGLVAEDQENPEYDDEYDDSYDDFIDTEPKMKMRLHGSMKTEMLPENVECPESEDEADEPTSGPGSAPKANPLDFCENPEVIRARREKAFQNRMAKKHPHQQPQKPIRDVEGNQKGQGQSDDVLRNRQVKGANKSSRANHNRRQNSMFKQSRGMF